MKTVHLQALLLPLLLAMAQFATAADDYKVIKLEQDVRKLEQEVRDLSRQIAELRRQAGTLSSPTSAPEPREPAAPSGSSPWLQAKTWQRLEVGMSELQVIDTLGPPTSTRDATDAGSKVLFYAMEIATGNYLSGSVEMRDRRVVKINPPALK
jgi:TolA-binding protein